MDAPTCPPGLLDKLKEHDRRLDLHWLARNPCDPCSGRGLWEVRERLQTTGAWSHITYWAEGNWPNLRYRSLPETPDPILEKLGLIDLARMGMDLSQYSTYLDGLASQGASKRADVQREQMRRKMAEYYAWSRRRASTILRRAQYGGRSERAALQEYAQAKEDAGL